MEARNVDRILAGELVPSPNGAFGWSSWPDTHFTPPGAWLKLQSPVIVVDNVADYVFPMFLKENKKVPVPLDLPSIAPPFPDFWLDLQTMEFPREGHLNRWSIFCYAIRLDRDDASRNDDSVKGRYVVEKLIDFDLHPDACWVMEMLVFWDAGKLGPKRKRSLFGPLTPVMVQLDEGGSLIDLDPETPEAFCGQVQPTALPSLSQPENEWHEYTKQLQESPDHEVFPDLPTEHQRFLRLLATFLYPAFFSLSLMHCRNVEITEHEPSQKEQRAFRKKAPASAAKLNSYHVLVIDPNRHRKVRNEDEEHDPTGRKMKLHVVRGHFKTFTKEKPLLGKAVGTYWWADNVRGDPKLGMAAKDYSVKP